MYKKRTHWLVALQLAALTCLLGLAARCDDKVKWPALGTAKSIVSGVPFHENKLQRNGLITKVWIYKPTSLLAGNIKKAPCILIAPAGTSLWHGMNLAAEDQTEHIPYVRAGFIVVAYTVSGFHSGKGAEEDVVPAAKLFQKSQAGLSNAKIALDFALARVPAIDEKHIFAVGHSSAGTTALWVSSAEPRIAACVAYAPVGDVPSHLRSTIPTLDSWMPNYSSFLQRTSPRFNVSRLKKPVFLFHAQDDATVRSADMESFYNALKGHNSSVTFERVPTGGHYVSMVRKGIPKAISWLQKLVTRVDEPIYAELTEKLI